MARSGSVHASTCRWLAGGLLLIAGLTAWPPSSHAQAKSSAPTEVAGGPAWSSLSPAQQQALQPLQREWTTIDTPRKHKWIELASRFHRLPPDEQTRVQQRMADWARLSPKQRSEARLNYQGARELSPQERQERWDAYKALSEDQQRKLAARAKAGVPPTGRSAQQVGNKVNTVPNPLLEARRPRAIAPTIVQAKPGATTNLISTRQAPPPHQQPGLPKVVATPEFVDSTTLLPQRGPQGAAAESQHRR